MTEDFKPPQASHFQPPCSCSSENPERRPARCSRSTAALHQPDNVNSVSGAHVVDRVDSLQLFCTYTTHHVCTPKIMSKLIHVFF